ncbi:MAG: sigma-54-dependent Fis family transcriptional regulator [Deltaproteobacteria bacterium]|nr:sigma-54-dependent Fis family transcriptional regulator [Deltaproteobacteria bacterium]MBW2446756.1 sigma-54-dependent Fis family transcriptional regulator [Deltaproteobacteria bacterium]
MASILLVEDELTLARQVRRALEASGHEVNAVDCGGDVLPALERDPPDLVLLDLRLPDASGLDVLSDIRRQFGGLPVVLMTAYSSVEDAVEAMRRGASDYLSKPLDLDKLRQLVGRLIADQLRDRELDYHRHRSQTSTQGVVTSSPVIHGIFDQLERLAEAGLPPGKRPAILLTGETGTGKGVLARAIHDRLGDGPFIEVNCTAMPASMVEAELFGHEKGSFTDARVARPGLVEAAEGGTLFLDEIGHLQLDLQAKFLKVIDERRVRRLGSSRDRAVDVHVIAATNRDLDEAVRESAFREDLLHRLRVLSFEIPPLRERPEDIDLLAPYFCDQLGQLYGGRKICLSDGAAAALRSYPWTGNVRELRNVIERAILLTPEDELRVDQLVGLFQRSNPSETPTGFALPEGGVRLEELELHLLRQALERAQGNRTRAAALLGLSRHALRYRMEKHGIV